MGIVVFQKDLAAVGAYDGAAYGQADPHAAPVVAAALLLAAGLFNGSARDVFGKAVKICTECVGLG